jgi:hypothetical protein
LATLAAGFAAFAAGVAAAFFRALRADGGGTALARTDGFDFATVFLDFATALAMDSNYLDSGEMMRALHHFEGFRASRETPLSSARSETS